MASQEYNRRVDVLIRTLQSSLTATELAEVRELVAQEKPWEALFSLAWIIERRDVSVPVETRRRIAHLAEAWIAREHWPESFRGFFASLQRVRRESHRCLARNDSRILPVL